ncbi:(3R)-hydroxyacyl-ACP dehydratase subunit HadA [Rhodococcus sp. NPDC059234]|uniref:(3R)-hydroxyacyl-ACP dehydratase subunit HadA n=1 Tax=Rhodococcus sp. NPDC059234 TaxID=3346781 RepID=UPI00366E82D6
MKLTADLVGLHHRFSDYYEVGREKVREYARAVKNDDPAFRDEAAAQELGYDTLIAPLTFISVFGFLAQEEFFNTLNVELDLSRILHTDQRLVFHRPMKVGDRLYCDVFVDSLRVMGGSDIIVTRNDITDQDGELVLTTYTTLMGRHVEEGE